MSVNPFGPWTESSAKPLSKSSVWRLGDVLDELLGQYSLTPCSSPEGNTAVCGQSGLFAATDLSAVPASAY